MFCTAAQDATVIGKTLARKIRNTGAESAVPNHRIASGIQAIGEMGRRTWIIGLNAWYAGLNQPSRSPNGTPISTAKVNPQVTRKSDATMYLNNKPCSASSAIPATTSSGAGTISLPV